MAFFCPLCLGRGTLEIAFSLSLPPDGRSDDIYLQVMTCEHCGFGGLAVYEESRRGRLDSESWEHTGYWIDEDTLRWVAGMMRDCPDPGNPYCECASHRSLGRRGPYGRWKGVTGITDLGTFNLKRVED